MSQDWQNISDDDLDDLFRKAAETENISFEPDSWHKMSQKLDVTPLVQKNESRLKKALPLLLLLFLLSFVGGYFFINHSAINISSEMTDQTNSSHKETPTIETLSGSSESETLGDKEKHQQTNDNITKNPVADLTKNTTPNKIKLDPDNTNGFAENVSEIHSQKKSADNTSRLPKRNVSKSTEKLIEVANTKSQTHKNIIVGSETSDKPAYSKASKDFSNQSVENQEVRTEPTSSIDTQMNGVSEALVSKTELSNLSELISKQPTFRHNLKLPSIYYQAENQIQPNTSQASISYKKGFNFRLSVSPDISTVSFNEVRKIGTNIGILVEYRYNNRWSVQTGLIRSLKIYEAYPEQYTWIWKMPNTPLLDINATCKMYDIPLNIRYDITQKAKTRWFVSGGVTTYRMLEETYIYNYENNDDPSIKWKKWVGSTGSYPFKVINISSGYEKEFRRNLTFQIEPFVKIPTAKVGFGKVNLSTVGVFLSAKYHIGK